MGKGGTILDGADREQLRLVIGVAIAHAYISDHQSRGASTDQVAAYAIKQAEALIRAAEEFKP